VTSVRVPGFLPSQQGFHFANDFPHEPDVSVPLPDGRSIGIGDAADGLCGGMVYAVCDYYAQGQPPPAQTTPPAAGSPLFDYLVQRLLQSFELPCGVTRYLELMNPLVPDSEPSVPGEPLVVHSRAWVMINEEWPKVKADLDTGRLSPIGLITVKSYDLRLVGKNHQVAVYGYDLDGTDLVLHVYDPNYPDDDGVALALSLADPSQPTPVTYTRPEPVFCFFHTDYAPDSPVAVGAADAVVAKPPRPSRRRRGGTRRSRSRAPKPGSRSTAR
jgi:hypothetical protein